MAKPSFVQQTERNGVVSWAQQAPAGVGYEEREKPKITQTKPRDSPGTLVF